MALNKLLIVFMFVFTAPAFAQEKFLEICNDPTPYDVTYVNDMRWLKYYFKTEDCTKVASEISKLTSFNEFMVPSYKSVITPFTWEEDFGYLAGLTTKMSLEIMPWSKLGFEPDETNVFKHPELYSEFKSLSVLDLTTNMNFWIKDLCHINRILPHVKRVVVSYGQLFTMEKCQDYTKIPWIIISQADGKTNTKLHSRIIGIQHFAGSVKNLIKFRYLQYLGIKNATVDNDLRFLSKNINLTHLSLDVKSDLKNIDQIRELRNLRYLSLSCIKEIRFDEDTLKITSLIPCKVSPLTDISFLAELPWLEKLSLVAHNLEDVSVVAKIKRLKSLNLSYNNIAKLPDLSHLKDLKQIDISHNPVNP